MPRLPLADPRRYGERFRPLAAFEEALRQASQLGDQLVQGLYDGLTDGTVRPEHSSTGRRRTGAACPLRPIRSRLAIRFDDQEHQMYGPGTAPPQPRPAGRGAVIALRVLFTVLPVLSLGFLAWGSLLRLAVVRRRPLDWALMVFGIVAVVVGFTLVGLANDDTDTWQSNVGTLTVLACMFGTAAYFLVMDIKGPAPRPAAYATPVGYMPPNPYATGYGPVPGPVHSAIPRPAPMQTPMPSRTPMPPQQPAPPPRQPAPRINQVRAELDELSDYLRKEEGR